MFKRSNLLTLAIILTSLVLGDFAFCQAVQAQTTDKLTLTIAPPLIKINLQPGEVWQSAIKVVNNNNQDTAIYLQALDFTSSDNGGVMFIPKNSGEENQSFALSQWLRFESGPIVIPAQASEEIPFVIELPATAEPGGHYAAILAGTKPGENISGSGIKISSLLASLIMLEVKGELVEKAQIREFSTDKKIYSEPVVNFTVRLENTGNIHIQPQGEIKIYNQFGQERGTITINHNTEYGNVLPKSIRRWQFSWQGEKKLTDMGRYKAVLVLGYGERVRETVYQPVYFWLVYYKPILLGLSLLILLTLIIIFLLRWYIKRAIKKTTSEAGLILPPEKIKRFKISVIPADHNGNNIQDTLDSIKPVKQKTKIEAGTKKMNWLIFKKYFFIALAILLVVLVLVVYISVKNYFLVSYGQPKPASESGAQVKSREKTAANQAKQLETGEPGTTGEIASSTILSLAQNTAASSTEPLASSTEISDQITATTTAEPGITKQPSIAILNGSGEIGVAAQLDKILKQHNFIASRIANADNFNYSQTLIKFKKEQGNAADLISKLISGPVEMQEVDSQSEDIVIIIGSNFNRP